MSDEPPYVDCFIDADGTVRTLGYKVPTASLGAVLIAGGREIPRSRCGMMKPNATRHWIDSEVVIDLLPPRPR